MSTLAVIDHQQLGLSRIIQQFRESPKFNAFISGLMALSNDVEACLQQMQYLADIDMMSGANLDVIGIIVGVSRIVPDVVELSWFGFEDTGTWATVFGEEGIPNIGSRFFEEGETIFSTTLLQDVEYRLILKARIVKNNSACTPEDIISGMRYIFGVPDIKYSDINTPGYTGPKMSFSLSVGRPIFAFEQAIITVLDILPRPAGCNIFGAVTSYVPAGEGYTGGTEGEDF